MIGDVLPSVRITNTVPNSRHRGGSGCFALALAPVVALAVTLTMIRKRIR